jgi:hypothetical protein
MAHKFVTWGADAFSALVPHADLFMLRSLPRNSSVTHPVVAVLVEAEKSKSDCSDVLA